MSEAEPAHEAQHHTQDVQALQQQGPGDTAKGEGSLMAQEELDVQGQGHESQGHENHEPAAQPILPPNGPLLAQHQEVVYVTDQQGNRHAIPTAALDMHSLLPMLLAQPSQGLAQTLAGQPGSLLMPAAMTQQAADQGQRQENLDYRSGPAFQSSGATFQGNGAFAPLRPAAQQHQEGAYAAGEAARGMALHQQPYQGNAQKFSWQDQVTGAALPPQHQQFEHQEGQVDGTGSQQHPSFEHLVEHAAAQHSQAGYGQKEDVSQEQGEPGTLIRPQAHKPPQATKSSRYRGVYKRQRGGRWEASIVLDGKNCRLGLHLTEAAAARAYDRVAIKKWGPDEAASKINFSLDQYNLMELEQISMNDLVTIVRAEWRTRDQTRQTPVGSYQPYDAPGLENPMVAMPEEGADESAAKRQKLDEGSHMRLMSQADEETQERVPIARSSMYRGVSTHKQSGKWVAQIKSGGKQVYLGFYGQQEDAARAYDQAVIHMQGEQAETNFPLEQYAERFEQLRAMEFKDLVAALKQHGRGGAPRVPKDGLSDKGQVEKSSFRGVAPDKSKKWRAQITIQAKQTVYLGLWASEEGAARAYDRASIAKRGEGARTNYNISDYANEIEDLQNQDFDALVAGLREEAVASVATERANKRSLVTSCLLAPIPPIQSADGTARPYETLEHAQQFPGAAEAQEQYVQQGMDPAVFHQLNQAQLAQAAQAGRFPGQPASLNAASFQNFLASRSNPRQADFLFRVVGRENETEGKEEFQQNPTEQQQQQQWKPETQ